MNEKDKEALAERVYLAANRLGKWRSFFAGWHLGTKPATDGPTRALRNQYDMLMLMRAEVSALTVLVKELGVSDERLLQVFATEYEALSANYSKEYPGIVATDLGLQMDAQTAAATMKRLGFPA